MVIVIHLLVVHISTAPRRNNGGSYGIKVSLVHSSLFVKDRLRDEYLYLMDGYNFLGRLTLIILVRPFQSKIFYLLNMWHF